MTDPLERYLDDFGARLGEVKARPARTSRARPIVAIAVAGIAAATAVAVLTGSTEPLDPVAEAQAALDAPGEIVYMKVTSRAVPDPGLTITAPVQTSEQWSTVDPRRWRLVMSLLPTEHGPPSRRAGRRSELSYGDGEQRSHRTGSRVVAVTQGIPDDSPAARMPSILGSGTGDPMADLRSMLGARGKVTDLGEVRAGGRTVRRLVKEQRVRGELVRRLVYDVDPRTFEPVAATFSVRSPLGGAPRMLTMRMHVDAYERIPLDTTTAKLLRIQTPPGVRRVVETAARRQARLRRAILGRNPPSDEETCVIVKRGQVCGTPAAAGRAKQQ